MANNIKKINNSDKDSSSNKSRVNKNATNSFVRKNVSFADSLKINLINNESVRSPSKSFNNNTDNAHNSAYSNNIIDYMFEGMKNSIDRLEKIVESNSLKIDTLASTLDKLLNSLQCEEFR